MERMCRVGRRTAVGAVPAGRTSLGACGADADGFSGFLRYRVSVRDGVTANGLEKPPYYPQKKLRVARQRGLVHDLCGTRSGVRWWCLRNARHGFHGHGKDRGLLDLDCGI